MGSWELAWAGVALMGLGLILLGLALVRWGSQS